MSKANHATNTPHQEAIDVVADYMLPVTDNRFDAVNIRPGDHLYFIKITEADPPKLDGKLVHAHRSRLWDVEEVFTDAVWRAALQSDGTLKLTTQSTLDDFQHQSLVYPTNDARDVVEIRGRATGHLQHCANFDVKPLADLLWVEPEIDEPSDEFAHYLAMREVFRDYIDCASRAPEPKTGATEVDRLCTLLREAALPVIHREPRARSDAVEAAIVIRDQFYDPGNAEPHSCIDGTAAARLIAAMLATVSAAVES